MRFPPRIFGTIVLVSFVGFSSETRAQFTLGADSSRSNAYTDGWQTGDNGGFGFNIWTLSNGQPSGQFSGNYTTSNPNNGVSFTGGGAFMQYAKFNVAGTFANADRGFNSIAIGDVLSFQWGANWTAGNSNGAKGFNVYVGGTSGSQVINLNLGNSDAITLNGSGVLSAYGTTPLTINMRRESSSSIVIWTPNGRNGGAGFTNTITGLANSSIDAIRFYISQQEDGDNRNTAFNNFSITNSGVYSVTTTQSRALTGSGALVVSNNSTLTLTADGNTFTGGTTIQSGSTLSVGNGGGTGDIGGDIVNSGALIFNRNANILGYSGVISGGGGVTKNGAGGLITLSGVNTYTGKTIINGGTISIGAESGLGGTVSSLTADQLQFGGGTLAVTGTGFNMTSNRGITLNSGGGTIDVVSGGTLAVTGAVAGSGALTKANTGALTLSGVNTYNGGTTLSAGTLNINSTTALGATASTFTISGGTIDNTSGGAITLANNNAQNWNGDFTFTGGNDLNLGTGAVTLGAARQVTVTANNLTVGGIISGGFGITKLGNGTLTLSGSGANTFSGGSTVSAGTLILNKSANVNAIAGSLTVNSGATLRTDAANQLNSQYVVVNGAFDMNGNNQTFALGGSGTVTNNAILTNNSLGLDTFSGVISGSGAVVKTNTGTNVFSGNNTYTGGTTVGQGTLRIGAGGTTGSILGNITNNGTVTFNRSDNITYSDIMSGTGSFQKWGAGILTLSGANTINGADHYLLDGTTLFTVSQGAGFGGNLNLGDTIGSAPATLSLTNGISINNPVIVRSGTGTRTIQSLSTSQTNTLSGDITLNKDATFDSASGGGLVVSGVLSGNGSMTKTGLGTVVLNASNSFSGGIIISAGTLSITNANSLGAGQFNFGNGNTLTTLLINSNVTITNTFQVYDGATNAVLNVASGITNIISGKITQNGTDARTKFGKDGSGTLILNNSTSDYKGQIQVGQGTLIFGNANGLGGNISTANRGIDLGLNIGDTSTGNNVSVLASNGITVAQSIYVAPNTSGGTRTIGISGNGTATFNNEIYMDGDLIIDSASGGNTVNVSGKITQNQTNGSLAGIIKNSAGTATLGGASDYKGNTTINAGVLQISASNNLGASTNSVLIASGATLRSTANLTNTRAITVTGGTGYVEATNGTTNTLNGTLTKNGTILVLGGGGTHIVNGSITGANANSDLVVSNSTTTINSTNSYNGPTFIVAGGTLNNGINNALPTNTALTLGQTGETSQTNTYNLNGYSQTVDSVATAGGGVNVITNTTITGNLTLNGTASNSISNLRMGGTGLTLTKAGANTVTLVTNNSIGPGTIAIQQGTLLLGASNQIGDTTAITMSGGTLDANGLSDVVGRLSFTGSNVSANLKGLNAGTTGNFVFSDLDTSSFGNLAQGGLVFTGGTGYDFNNGFRIQLSTENLSNTALTTFNTYTDKVSFGVGQQTGAISFTGGGGTYLTVAAIPEPKVYIAAGTLALLIAYAEVRRRKRATRA